MQDNERYQVLATKVSAEAYKRLQRLARKKRLTIYELIQMVCDTLIRYMDDGHNLTPQLEQAMSIFEHMEGFRDALNIADPSVEKEVGEATYYLYDPAGKKKGSRAVHVTKPFFGEWSEDCNVQHILERTICLLMPERYKRLRSLAVEKDCSSLLELFDQLIDFHAKEEDLKTIREEFEDANRSEFGVRPKEDGPYRRHNNQPLDMFVEAERRREEEAEQEKQDEAKKWLEDNMDFRPCGYEW